MLPQHSTMLLNSLELMRVATRSIITMIIMRLTVPKCLTSTTMKIHTRDTSLALALRSVFEVENSREPHWRVTRPAVRPSRTQHAPPSLSQALQALPCWAATQCSRD